jgi:hypothetical protein
MPKAGVSGSGFSRSGWVIETQTQRLKALLFSSVDVIAKAMT